MGLAKKGFIGLTNFKQAGNGKRYCDIPVKDKKGNDLRVWVNTGFVIPKGFKSKMYAEPYSIDRLVWGLPSDNPEKVVMVQELRWKDERKELRFCYYTVSSETNKTRKGVWTWGQYALITPKEDIEELLRYATEMEMLSLN
jgi:hypothetical protein